MFEVGMLRWFCASINRLTVAQDNSIPA
jgi:hypothetical protein